MATDLAPPVPRLLDVLRFFGKRVANRERRLKNLHKKQATLPDDKIERRIDDVTNELVSYETIFSEIVHWTVEHALLAESVVDEVARNDAFADAYMAEQAKFAELDERGKSTELFRVLAEKYPEQMLELVEGLSSAQITAPHTPTPPAPKLSRAPLIGSPVVHLGRMAKELSEAKEEINRAREQSTKPKHLFIHARRTAVQAARVVIEAVDRGIEAVWPTGTQTLQLFRNGEQVGSDGALSDDTVLLIWTMFICPTFRSTQVVQRADAGEFDFPNVKTDENGNVLGKDGMPLVPVSIKDPSTGKQSGWKLNGEPASVTDNYDAADALEHYRCQALDWADVCGIGAELFRSAAQEITPEQVVDRRTQLCDCLRTLFKGPMVDDTLRQQAGLPYSDDEERRSAAHHLAAIYSGAMRTIGPWLRTIAPASAPVTLKATRVGATAATAHQALLEFAENVLLLQRNAANLKVDDSWQQLRDEQIDSQAWAHFQVLLENELRVGQRVVHGQVTLATVFNDAMSNPLGVPEYESWPLVQNFGCRLFGHIESEIALIKRVAAWLVAEQGVVDVNAAYGLPLTEIAVRLKAAVRMPLSADNGTRLLENAAKTKQQAAETEYAFYRDGDHWQVKGFGESGTVRHLKGMDAIHRLLITPGNPVAMAELAGATEALWLRHGAATMNPTAMAGLVRATAADRYEGDGHSRQETLDNMGLQKVRNEMAELKEDLADAERAGDLAAANEAQQKIDKLEQYVCSSLGLNGQARDMNNPLDTWRPTICARLNRAYKVMREASLNRVAEHLSAAISSKPGVFIYSTGGLEITWQCEKTCQ